MQLKTKHHQLTYLCLFLLLSLTPFFLGQTYASRLIGEEKPVVKVENLVKNKWILAQIVKTKNDTSTNLTLFMLPCEKDNFTQYSNDGTYNIYEGDSKCGSDDIHGFGEWEFDAASNMIFESYKDSPKVEKQVLELTDKVYKVSFDSEGRSTTTLTYISQEAISANDISIEKYVDDSSNPVNSVRNILRDVLLTKGRYIVLGNYDVEMGTQIEDEEGVKKTVWIAPIFDYSNTDGTANENDVNKLAREKARRSNVDYIVTGDLRKAKTTQSPDGNYQGDVQFELKVIDPETGNVLGSKSFKAGSGEAKSEKGRLKNLTLGDWFSTILGAVALRDLYDTRHNYWGYYYNGYFRAEQTGRALNQMSRVFSTEGGVEREAYYKKTVAIISAIEEASFDVSGFVDEKLPISLYVNEVVKKKGGAAKILKLEGGENCKLSKNDKLIVVRYVKNKLRNGRIVKETITLGELKVTDVENHYLSICRVTKGGKEILKAIQENSSEVEIITTAQKKGPF